MKLAISVFAILVAGLLLFGCLEQPPAPPTNETTNATTNVTPTNNSNQTSPTNVTNATTNVTPVTNETVVTVTKCNASESCFYSNLASCSLAEFVTGFGVANQSFQLTIGGPEGDSCAVNMSVLASSTPAYVGTMIECMVPRNVTTKDAFVRQFNPAWGASVLNSCSGTYVDALKKAYGIP